MRKMSEQRRAYAVAGLAATAAALGGIALGTSGAAATFLIAYPAVLFSAWYGGLGPGCVAAGASVVINSIWFGAEGARNDMGAFGVGAAFFLVSSALGSWLIAKMQSFRRELAVRVDLRTAELSELNQRLQAEIAQRQHAEERFRSAFEHAPVGMALVGIDGRTFRVNRALCEMFGYSGEELLSFPVWAITQPDDMMSTIEQLQRLIEGEIEHWELEKRFFHKDGHIVWGWSTTSLVRDGAGKPLYVISQVQDITARKQAEAALREEHNFASAVVDTVGALVGVVDCEGRIVRFNRACERALGYTAAEVIGRSFWDLLPAAEEIGAAKKVFEMLLAGKWPQEYETYWIRRDGTPCLLAWSTAFLRDEHGSVRYVVGSGIDITERKQAEAALRASEERFQHAFESAPIGMALVGLDSIPLQVNRALSEMLGYSQEELLRKAVPEITYPDDMETAYRDRERLLAGEVTSYQADRRYYHQLGHIVWAELNVSVARAPDGTPLYLVTQLQDITARKQAEDALRASEERFQIAFQHAPIGIGLIGLDRRFLQVNRALSEVLGFAERELLALPFTDLVHAEDRAQAIADSGRVIAGEFPSYRAERRYLHKSGSVIRAAITVSLLHDHAGNPLCCIFQFEDITQRKRAEEMLRKAHDELEGRVLQRTAELAATNARLQEEVARRELVEERLRRGKEFLERLINSSVDGILAFDREYRYTLWNRGMERIIGLPAAEVLGKSALDLFPFLREIGQQEVFADVLRGHALGVGAHPYVRPKTGERGFYEGHYSPLFNAAGETVGGLGIIHDITARKRAEDELEIANKRTLRLLDAMSAGFFAVDAESRVTYMNRGAEELTELSRDTVMGKNLWEVFPGARDSPFGEQYEKVRSERVTADVEAYYPPYNRWIRAHIYPAPDGVCSLFEDVTERHTQEAAVLSGILQALNARLEVAEAFPAIAVGLRTLTGCDFSGLFLFDEDGEWVRAVRLSTAGTSLDPNLRIRTSDLPAAATIRSGRSSFIADLATVLHAPIVQALYDLGYRSSLSLPLRGARGTIGMLSVIWQRTGASNAAQLPLLAQIADAVALATEKHQLFEQVRIGRERLQALSRRLLEVQEGERRHIARELHDEIGQHLTGLKLLLESVERNGPQLGARLGEAHKLVEDLVARVREMSLDLRPAMLDDLGLLPAFLWLFDRYSAQTGVRVDFEHAGLEGRLPQDVETAAYRIVQEALTNVARYAGVPEVSVRAWAEDGTLRLHVVDRGAGFQPEGALASRLTSGLAGIRERVLLLGGDLAVDSAPGTGTRLRAALPLFNGVAVREESAACSA